MKITDVTVKRYSASREPRKDPGGIQVVEVHTDAGVTGMGFVSAGTAISDVVATLITRNLKAVAIGPDVKLMVDVNGTWDVDFVLVPPDAPGLGLELDETVAAASLVPE